MKGCRIRFKRRKALGEKPKEKRPRKKAQGEKPKYNYREIQFMTEVPGNLSYAPCILPIAQLVVRRKEPQANPKS